MFRQRLPVCAFAFFSEASLLSMDLLRLLIEAWKRMASGNAIDEQYRDVWAMHEAAYNARREERDVADRDGPSSDQAQAWDSGACITGALCHAPCPACASRVQHVAITSFETFCGLRVALNMLKVMHVLEHHN